MSLRRVILTVTAADVRAIEDAGVRLGVGFTGAAKQALRLGLEAVRREPALTETAKNNDAPRA